MSSKIRSIHSSPTQEEQQQQRPSECSSDDRYDCSPGSTMSFPGSPATVTEMTMENENLTHLKLEAMTWAAMAKDFAITSLEGRLRKVLQIAKAEQVKNQELQSSLDQTRQELSEARTHILSLEGNEEPVAKDHQYGGYEADVTSNFAGERSKLHTERSKQHRLQLLLLEHRIRLMLGDRDKATATKGNQKMMKDRRCSQDFESYDWGSQGIDNEILEQKLDKSQEREKSLVENCAQAEREMEELKRQLADVRVDLRVSEVLRRAQSRRLRVLERERRYLLRNSRGLGGIHRKVKLSPPMTTRRIADSTIPGGSGKDKRNEERYPPEAHIWETRHHW
ncbi:hypothetical protein R1sor_006429 [Riccia sorocarpa]|uniref:Uncharacterized protein n=1 Tax=Riccia sorocarpa TaxID=122646 RepID=A0ABD3HMD2_9MARC